MQFSRLPFATAVLLSLHFPLSAATTHYVDANGTNSVSPYTSWATAATNIQLAASVAVSGDLVLVTNGDYQTGGNAATARVFINASITVQSVNGAAVTTINGAGVMRCVLLSPGSKLLGFTLANGAAGTHSGGGVDCLTADAFAGDCIFTNNSGVTGGGAQSGTFSNCMFIANVATNYGGGAYGATVYQCSFVSNTAGFYGGGAYQSTLVNCSLTGNSVGASGWGGGAYFSTLVNCLLTGNQAGYRGGAAFNCGLLNCTVANNTGQPTSIESCKLTNCICYYNSPDNSSTGQGNNHFGNCCTIPLPDSGVNTVTNPPAFVNLAAGDFHLSAASPCINAGNNSFITNATDLDGNSRIVGGTVDLGAYEYHPAVLYVSVTNTAPVSPFTNWSTAATNIQDAIDAANAGDSIVVGDGLYNTGGRVVYTLTTNRVVLNKAVTVQSVNGPGSTVIAGYLGVGAPNANVRCAYLTNGASLIGFTLTNGRPVYSANYPGASSGGGAWCEGNGATLSNCVLAGNVSVEYGGGAFQGTLLNCVLTNNSGGFGGAACSNILINCTLIKNIANQQNYNSGGGAFYCTLTNCLVVGNVCNGGLGGGGAYSSTLTGCVVSNNTAFYGGGVLFGLINNCLISSNRVITYGGGGYSNVLNNCVLQNNYAPMGGGGACGSALTNCTLSANSTGTGKGGGAYSSTLTGCVVSNNTATTGGGVCFGVINNSLVSSNRAASGGGSCSNVLNNCILENNFASAGGGAYGSSLINCTVVSNTAKAYATAGIGGGVWGGVASNCIICFNWADEYSNYFTNAAMNNCCTTPLPMGGFCNITNDPAFVNLSGGDYHLQTNSPCINAGNNAFVTVTNDLDGNARIVGGTVDMGAYEFQSPASIISYAWLQQYGLPTDGSSDFAYSSGDSFNNWQEWHAGMNPADPATQLQMLSPPPTNNASGITVTWQSISGINYFIQRGSDLGAQPVFTTIQSNLVGQTGTTIYTDMTATNGVPYFYRVGVQ